MQNPNKCIVCKRKVIGHSKGNTVLHGSNYCSKYCKLFQRNNLKMINGAEKHGNNQYAGFNYWPSIIVPCDTCSADVKMTHGKEKDDRVFCSRACNIQVKTCRKNAMKDYTVLRVLREHPESLPSNEIAYYVSNQHQYQVNGAKISMLLRKWVSKGIVEKTDRGVQSTRVTSKKVCYRLSEKYQDAPLGALVIKHRTPRGYADAKN